uniref:Phosphoribosyl transferase domain-containing protein n=1 Tax=Candidatus Kentrum sp. DK TaxID=2126562 RepID=A0A450SZM7_9GAMM|nr:MAG: Phosphoribosyl transferase domain-containing protein [Candidatus Kentron sp. DK]
MLRIAIPGGILGDDGWAAHFGVLQDAMREGRFLSQTFTSVVLDLSRCIWADPLPLLAFTMALGEFVLQGKGAATVVLPESSTDSEKDKRATATEYDRLLKFLALDGFLEQMIGLGISLRNSQGSEITEGEIKKFEDAVVSLRYVNSQCIPALVLDLSKDEEGEEGYKKQIDDKLNEGLERAELLLRAEERPWANTRLLYTLQVFLRETMTNVAEHAYYQNTGRSRLVGIYVRYRQGRQGVLPEGKENLKNALRDENSRCPRLDRNYLDGRTGCLEVFVMDTGIGMVGRFEAGHNLEGKEKKELEALLKKKKSRFPQLLYSVFHDGFTTKGEGEKPTRAGGLELIYQSLRQNHDYLRGLDDNLWVGFQADFPRENASNRTPALRKGDGGSFEGLAWTARFSWPKSTVDPASWAIWQGEGDHPALEVFTQKSYSREGFDPIIFDQRFGPSDRFLSDDSRAEDIGFTGQREILWLVRPGLMKNDIGHMIKRIAKRFIGFEDKEYTLYIADIPDHEAATYLLIVESLQPNLRDGNWPEKLRGIVLATRSFAISIHHFEDNTNTYKTKPGEFIENVRRSPKFWRQRDILGHLRLHDSELFWKEIEEHKEDLAYLPEEITWHEEDGRKDTLDGYLDFSQSVTHSRCRKLYRIAMQRLAGLFPGRHVEMRSLDRLTDTLAEEFNANQSDRETGNLEPDAKPALKIRLGSVHVSGSTVNAAEKPSEDAYTIHFFAHGGFSGESESHEPPRSLFMWLPPRAEDGNQTGTRGQGLSYGRIGRTPAIGKGGRKHFLVPRLDEDGNPMVARTPAETYGDWQQPMSSLLASGHWQYESHHDFITLNILQAIQLAALGLDPLAQYLFRQIICPLQPDFQDLSPIGQQLWKKVEECVNEKGADDDRKARAVIYPFHPNTTAAVNSLLACFSEKVLEEYRNRFIPVQPVRRRQGHGAMLFSPLAMERVRKLLEGSDEGTRNVLLFDDALITGHTMDELIRALKRNGAKEVRTVAILDRRRLPAVEVGLEKERFFWRLDVAHMGIGSACLLCKALELASQFEKAISASRDRERERVRAWFDIWRPVSPVSQWHRKLDRTPLDEPLVKRLGIPTGKEVGAWGEKHRVELKDSAGIAAYAAEIFTMTGLDDESLNLSEKAKEAGQALSPQTRVELFASQILLFGQEFGKDTLSSTFIQLLIAANEITEETPHTALAGLITLLLSGYPIEHKRVIDEALYADPENMDMDLALANLIWNGRLNGLEYPDTQRLLTSDGITIAERYDRLHMELAGISGDPHSTPLNRLKRFLREECPDRKQAALQSLEQLTDLLRPIDAIWARHPDEKAASSAPRSDISFQEEKERLREGNRKMKEKLERLDCNDGQERTSVSALAKEFFKNLEGFSRKYLFLHFDRKSLNEFPGPVEKHIGNLFCSIDFAHFMEKKGIEGMAPTLGISSNRGNHLDEGESVDLIWDWGVQDAIKRLLANAVYAKGKIQAPWGKEGVQEQHSLWLLVSYESERAKIYLCNAIDEAAEKIVAGIKRRPLSHIREIGGSIAFGEHDKNSAIFQAAISIPYAGYCRSLSVGQQR